MEAVDVKRKPPVKWEHVEVLNRFQWKTRSSSTAVKNSNIQRQRLDTRSVYKVTRCRCIRDGAKRSIAGVPAEIRHLRLDPLARLIMALLLRIVPRRAEARRFLMSKVPHCVARATAGIGR